MNRREMLARAIALGLTPLALIAGASGALAQRPLHPVYRPLPGRPGLPLRPGRFPGGVNYGAAPGVFIVVAVDSRENVVQLRDDEGRAAQVFVSPRLFDLAALAPGDAVAVDFFVGGDNDERLEAASIDRLERVPS